MTENEIAIPLADSGMKIYGTLRGSFDDPLIVLCHGYGGWRHEMLMYNGARAFEKAGYATLRLSMYGGGENSRNISESDVLTHARDIDDSISYARAHGSQWIGIAGHSYSGMAIVYSNQQNFDAAVLWDPTHTDSYDEPQAKENLKKDSLLVDDLNAYVSGRGSGYVYAKTVFDNDYPKSDTAAEKFTVPTCIINASWSEAQQQYGKKYAKHIKAPTRQITIPDTSHPFTSEGAADKLFQSTIDYFDELRS